MTPLPLRFAEPDDADALAALAMAVWPAERFDPALVARAMAEAGHRTVIATDGSALVGFVGCFATRTAAGATRWEIDLLAVHPAHQGKGIGRRLVAAGADAGAKVGAHYARALIALENIASQRAFVASGFAAVDLPHTLSLTEHADARALAYAHSWHRVPVVTFRYTGWWLEPRDPTMERALGPEIAPGDLVGILIRHDATARMRAAAAAGFAPAGDYQFWERQIGGIQR